MAEVLGHSGKADELLYPATGQSILVKAVQQPDRRLRMAAIHAIAQLNPQKPYPGSSNVTDALAYFAAGTGTRRALVAGPNLNKIPKLVSGLSAAGFTVDTVNSGKEVMEKLLASPDYEIAMIDAGVSRPSIDMLLQQIRRDARSADVRVGIIARTGDFEKAEHVADADSLTKHFPRPNEDDAVRWEAERLAEIKPRDLVQPEERLRQAGDALDLLAELARTSPKLYDIRRAQDSVISAMKIPSLAAKAVAVLANVNSPEAQQTLVATASRDTSPIELRQAAVEAFRASVQAHGILLKTDEILRQYDIYNQSKNADEATQKVLGLLLDCLEAPKK
jgi:CheY-like chemotaxis protein